MTNSDLMLAMAAAVTVLLLVKFVKRKPARDPSEDAVRLDLDAGAATPDRHPPTPPPRRASGGQGPLGLDDGGQDRQGEGP